MKKQDLTDALARIEVLEAEVARLDDGLQEARRINRRVAELTDVVANLLVPLAQHADPAVAAQIETYLRELR